jgi:hypothetical protein
MSRFSVSRFDDVSWFVSVYLGLLPSDLIDDDLQSMLWPARYPL